MTKEKISCVDCEHYFTAGGYGWSAHCAAIQAPCSVPSQGKTYPESVYDAWKKCKGKQYKLRRPWWKRLLGLK